ncbi:MAG: FkbM family methyltransferase [Planctomycetota bacterium]|nr:FkbM family methyltransferase [Planctomycetota bacterium]
MKPRELIYMLGIRPKPRKYSHDVIDYDLPVDGMVQYAQWRHPAESTKAVRQDEITELRSFLNPGDVAIDIGAHTGDTALPMALATGPEGCVLALEPNPYVYKVLEINSKLNQQRGHIIPLMFAATPEDGDFDFEYSDEGYCNGGLHVGISKWRHGHAFKLKVTGKHLPTYLAEHYPDLIDKIRFIKVDAEGFDAQILRSMQPLIKKTRPFIKAEVFKLTTRPQREQLFDFLDALKYQVHRVIDCLNYRGPILGRGDLMQVAHYDVFCDPGR